MAKTYDETDIKHLGYRDSTRAKPGMYIGATDDSGLFTILREVLDNAVDEALAGHCSACIIYADSKDTGYWVYDNGRGMPVGDIKIKEATTNKVNTMSALQAIVSLHHAGGKLDAGSSAYKTSRGSHGIGIKATNFLSDLFEVFTFSKGKWWTIQFKKGILSKPLTQCKAPKVPWTDKPMTEGTVVRFVPDLSIFSAKTFSLKYVDSWATLASYFTPKFKVVLLDSKGNNREYYAPGGPPQFVKDRVTKLGCTPLSPDTFVYQNELVDCVVKFTDYDGCDLQAFTNGLSNVEGGKHHQAVLAAIMSAITPFIKKRQEFTQVELREGIVGLINAKLSAPKFDSQTKEKLVDERCGVELKAELTTAFKKFFAANRSLAEKICNRCAELKNLRNKFIASKTVLKELKAVSKRGLPAKACMSPNCKPEERELFLVEGDSAGGSGKFARNPKYQEMLPLKGKILNALKHSEEKVLLSEEVLYILNMIGFDPNSPDPMSKLRVKGKIIFLADPDPDGPLLGSTVVPVMYEDTRFNVTMEELASDLWINRRYKVFAWGGKSFHWTEGQDCQLTGFVDKLVTITLESGEKIKCSEQHKWPIRVTRYDSRIEYMNQFAGLMMVPAKSLKPGDYLIAPLAEGPVTNDSLDPTHLQTQHYQKVVSCKTSKCEDTPVYCLTVPFDHNFLLGAGVLSGNCHINSLLLTLFFKYLPQAFERGLIYIAEAPEYYAMKKDGTPVFGNSASNLRDKLSKADLNLEIHHIKGYGELDPKLLEVIAFNPATRRLSQIQAITRNDSTEFIKLMAENTESRKELLGI